MPKPHHTTGSIEVLEVYLGEQAFGIPIRQVQDVLNSLQLTQVPLANSHIEGVANLRGRIVTAIDLRKRLKDKSAPADTVMNVVLEVNNELYSILVDQVGDVFTLEGQSLEEPPMTLRTELRTVMHSVHQLEKAIMIVLDTDRVIYAN